MVVNLEYNHTNKDEVMNQVLNILAFLQHAKRIKYAIFDYNIENGK